MNYKQILQNILEYGQYKSPVRFENGKPIPVANDTIGTFCEIFRHDMAYGFPLTSLRRMPFKSTCIELEGFLKGITKKQWYIDRGCNYWTGFSSPVNKPNGSRKEILEWQKNNDDLGLLGYSHGWRNFGFQTDQLRSMVDKLKTNPYDRRMVTSFWNPNELHLAALPSCHLLHNVVVYGNKLNLVWYQRSCDFVINQSITTYALLMLLLCKESGLEPGELVGVLADCHIYTNKLKQAKLMLTRSEKKLPTVNIVSKNFSIFDWEHNEVELIGYDPHPKINMGKITI